MEPQFWLNKWQANETGFHRTRINSGLQQFWRTLALDPATPVFVPLCGKSHDMLWLADQGHPVIGAELSPIAVAQFFAETKLTPEIEKDRHGFDVYTASQAHPTSQTLTTSQTHTTPQTPGDAATVSDARALTVWCGDFFRLPPAATQTVGGIYDRASLIALPPDLKIAYAKKLTELSPIGTKTLLITLDYDQSEMSGPPFATPVHEVKALFGTTHTIKILHHRDSLADNPNLRARGVTALTTTVLMLERGA